MEDKIEDWKALIILTGTQEEYHLQYILASSLIVKKKSWKDDHQIDYHVIQRVNRRVPVLYYTARW